MTRKMNRKVKWFWNDVRVRFSDFQFWMNKHLNAFKHQLCINSLCNNTNLI